MQRILSAVILSLGLIFAGSADAAELRGNPASKVYHKETCKYYTSKNATVLFTTEDGAKAKGFVPCKVCMLAEVKQKLAAFSNEPYVGNSNTKVFHKAGCKAAPKKNGAGLQNLLQARKNGFKPCKICKPLGDKAAQ